MHQGSYIHLLIITSIDFLWIANVGSLDFAGFALWEFKIEKNKSL